MSNLMDKIVALCKRRGLIYPSSEIYGGFAGFWDYGPLGTELKNNIKRQWWQTMVYQREDVVGIDAAIVMNPEVWKASGHLDAFTDPLVECKKCHRRFRTDQLNELNKTYDKVLKKIPTNTSVGFISLSEKDKEVLICEKGGTHKIDDKSMMTDPKNFNLMTEVLIGVTEPKQKAYLRGEITQGVFVNFQNVVTSSRVKIPFGIAQIGKAFRNEITPGNFTFRSREFEQMELEYFVEPKEAEAMKVFSDWKQARMDWYLSLGIKKENLHFRPHEDNEKAHYARKAEDIEYNSPFGWKEFEGIHHRGDWDLGRHKLTYKDEIGKEYTPWVIETSGGVDRAALFFLIDAYFEDKDRVILKLNPKLAPYKVAVFPLLANKPELVKLARTIYKDLKQDLVVAWDDRGNIGKRYYAQDEIGTPWCITVDFDSLKTDDVTIRDRDTAKQTRVKIKKLKEFFKDKLK
jgi:glycyl-tRNA synthetase